MDKVTMKDVDELVGADFPFTTVLGELYEFLLDVITGSWRHARMEWSDFGNVLQLWTYRRLNKRWNWRLRWGLRAHYKFERRINIIRLLAQYMGVVYDPAVMVSVGSNMARTEKRMKWFRRMGIQDTAINILRMHAFLDAYWPKEEV